MQTRVYERSPEMRPAAVCRISSGPGERLGRSDPRAHLLTIFLAIRSKRPSAPMAFSSGVSNQTWRNKGRHASRWLDRETALRLQNNSCHGHWRTQTARQAGRVMQFNAKESVMKTPIQTWTTVRWRKFDT